MCLFLIEVQGNYIRQRFHYSQYEKITRLWYSMKVLTKNIMSTHKTFRFGRFFISQKENSRR